MERRFLPGLFLLAAALERFPLRRSNAVTAMPRIVDAFVGREQAERRRHQVADLVEAPWPRRTKERFQFREGQFDRIEIRTVGRQKAQVRARLLDGMSNLRLLVDREVIEDQDIAGLKRRHEHLFDIREEHGTVDRPVKDGRRVEAIEAEGGDDRMRLPMTAGRVVVEPRPTRTSTVPPQQIGGDAAFVEKDVLPHIAERLPLAPAAPLSSHVWAPLLVGVHRFF